MEGTIQCVVIVRGSGIKAGSQYDAGVVSIAGKKYFFTSQIQFLMSNF